MTCRVQAGRNEEERKDYKIIIRTGHRNKDKSTPSYVFSDGGLSEIGYGPFSDYLHRKVLSLAEEIRKDTGKDLTIKFVLHIK